MDPLADLLGRARASGSLFAQTTFHGAGGLDLGGEAAPLAVHVVRDGDLWLRHGPRVAHLPAGSVVLVRQGAEVAFCAGPDENATPLAQLLTRAAAVDGVHRLDLRGAAAPAVLLCGAYVLDGSVCDRLLDALPPVVHVAAEGPLAGLLPVLYAELDDAAPGRQTALDRLLDLLLVHALRVHFGSTTAPAWYDGSGDREVAQALALLHADPAKPWTVEGLARAVGLSRAALARRFTAAVGEPPLTYLTGWRIALAKQSLEQQDSTLAAVAREVGYASEFALSAAFRRAVGEPPGRWRARHRAG